MVLPWRNAFLYQGWWNYIIMSEKIWAKSNCQWAPALGFSEAALIDVWQYSSNAQVTQAWQGYWPSQ